jgi:hypothetical protein
MVIVMATHAEFITRLTDLICESFIDQEFGELFFRALAEYQEENNEPDAQWDYAGLVGAYRQKAYATVQWCYRYDRLAMLLWLARVCRKKRPKIKKFEKLIAEMEAAIAAEEQQAQGKDAGGNGAPAANQPAAMPGELVGWISDFEKQILAPTDLAQSLRTLFRAKPCKELALPNRLHLSESDGERLTAVLALETAPDPAYLRWLSERVTVERPIAGLLAAQALVSAALRLSKADLVRVRRAVKSATDRLNELADTNVAPSERPFDIGARKRELRFAESLVDVREKQGKSMLTVEELDRFFQASFEAFDWKAVELLYKSVEVRPPSKATGVFTVELMIVRLAVEAWDNGWERDLIRAVYEAQPGNPIFAAMRDKYAKV